MLTDLMVKFTPCQSYVGTEGHDFKPFATLGLERGEWLAPRPGNPGKTRYPLQSRLHGYPGPVWSGTENHAPPPGSIPGLPNPQPVAIPSAM